ncbi:hypothetical protein BGX31_002283, partial [Mortierella sp. GBA43]
TATATARKPAMGTLSRIISKQSRYTYMTEIELSSQRRRAVVCAELEYALVAWIREHQERRLHVTYKMMTNKAKELATFIKTMPGNSDAGMPSFSNGWVSGFTKRNRFIGAALNAPGVVSVSAGSGSVTAAAHPNGSPSSSSPTTPPSLSSLVLENFSTNEELLQQAMVAVQERAERDAVAEAEMDADMKDASDTDLDEVESGLDDHLETQPDMAHDIMNTGNAIHQPPVSTTPMGAIVPTMQHDLHQVVNAVQTDMPSVAPVPQATAIMAVTVTATPTATTSGPAVTVQATTKKRTRKSRATTTTTTTTTATATTMVQQQHTRFTLLLLPHLA